MRCDVASACVFSCGLATPGEALSVHPSRWSGREHKMKSKSRKISVLDAFEYVWEGGGCGRWSDALVRDDIGTPRYLFYEVRD